MHAAHHQQRYELEYLPDNSGLNEFDVEGAEAGRPGALVRTLPGTGGLRLLTVVEQYEPCDIDTPLSRRDTGTGGTPALRLLRRLAMTVALVAIPSGTPVGTEGLPSPVVGKATGPVAGNAAGPAAGTAIRAPRLAEVPVPSVAPPSVARPVAAAIQTLAPARTPAPRLSTSQAAPRARTDLVSAPDPALIHQALASLNGPFMTFEQCEVRFASVARAVARCQGIENAATPGAPPPQPRRVEWTLAFDRTERRWLIVDSTSR